MSATKTKKKPTPEQLTAYQGMFDYFNRALWSGRLPPVLLNFSRHSGALGFFAPERWTNTGGSVAHEISLNPAHLGTRPARDTASTLVHGMAHHWQQEFGSPSRRGYHNHEWAAEMERVGLMPSSSGAPGGAKVGQRMTHYILDGGAFARAFADMPRDLLLPWACSELEGPGATKKPATPSKVKFTCPGCAANAWGKPALNLVCGDCEEPMLSEEA